MYNSITFSTPYLKIVLGYGLLLYLLSDLAILFVSFDFKTFLLVSEWSISTKKSARSPIYWNISVRRNGYFATITYEVYGTN